VYVHVSQDQKRSKLRKSKLIISNSKEINTEKTRLDWKSKILNFTLKVSFNGFNKKLELIFDHNLLMQNKVLYRNSVRLTEIKLHNIELIIKHSSN